MQTAFRTHAKVNRGGRIEVRLPELPVGKNVEVIILLSETVNMPKRSAADILAEAQGHRLFQTEQDVRNYLEEEHSSWDR